MESEICCFSTENASAIRISEMASRIEFGYAELFFKVQVDSAHDRDIYIDPVHDVGADTRETHRLTGDYDSHASSRLGCFGRLGRPTVDMWRLPRRSDKGGDVTVGGLIICRPVASSLVILGGRCVVPPCGLSERHNTIARIDGIRRRCAA